MAHRSELADYHGIFALFRDGAATISLPRSHFDRHANLLPPEAVSPGGFAASFEGSGFDVIGPAYIGYAEDVVAPVHPARALSGRDRPLAVRLQSACTEIEWDHGGSRVGEDRCSGVLVEGELVALAGYRVWPFDIAHIYVVSDPGFRGQGFGRSAVAHVARRALSAGLIPQYRTLESNLPSLRIADSLGFAHFASSVAVNLGTAP
ncbi:MAG: GNAT family N-acetyltransferase [Verrucomicrobiales bacterium]